MVSRVIQVEGDVPIREPIVNHEVRAGGLKRFFDSEVTSYLRGLSLPSYWGFVSSNTVSILKENNVNLERF